MAEDELRLSITIFPPRRLPFHLYTCMLPGARPESRPARSRRTGEKAWCWMWTAFERRCVYARRG